MPAKHPELYAKGQRARDRARHRAGGSRVSAQHWAPEIHALREAGYTNSQIAYALGLGERRVQQIMQEATASGLVHVTPATVDPEKWDAETRAMMEFSADGFERFYIRFSGWKALLPMHKEWVADFCSNESLILNVPPRHGKSHIFSVWIPLWLICMDRNHQILVCSAGGDLLKKLLRELFYHLESNEDLIECFGRFQPEKGSGVWRPTTGEAVVLGRTLELKSGQFSIEVRGAGQNILGSEATVLIVDDCTDPRVTRSPAENDKRMLWLREEVFTRLEPFIEGTAYGRCAVVGQRVGNRDIYGLLAEDVNEMGDSEGAMSWHVITHPAVLVWPEDGKEAVVLWPEKWSYEQLMRKFNKMGRTAFWTMYQQEPLDPANAWVRHADLVALRNHDRAMGQGYRVESEDEQIFPVVRVVSVDPSPRNWNAMVVADVLATKDAFHCTVIEFSQWKGGTREFQAHIDRAVGQYAPDYFILESSTATKWLEGDPYFQALAGRVNCILHTTGSNKHHEEWGVDSLRSDIESGRIDTPYGDMDGVECTALFERQAEFYGTGIEDDILMALWFIKWNWRRLVPRRLGRGTFTTQSEGGWGYLRREKSRKDPRAEMAKEWRKRHGFARV